MEDFTEKISTFNEAGFQMTRLHELQRSMNSFRINPFTKTHSPYQYDFELWVACIDGLYLEVSAKLNEKEDEEAMELLNTARQKMSALLVVSDTSTWGSYRNRKKMFEIRQALFDAEKKIRLLLDEHGLSSPNADDTSGDPFA